MSDLDSIETSLPNMRYIILSCNSVLFLSEFHTERRWRATAVFQFTCNRSEPPHVERFANGLVWGTTGEGLLP